MIQVDKDKVNIIRKVFPHVHIRRTANRYYVEESPKIIALLKRCGDLKE